MLFAILIHYGRTTPLQHCELKADDAISPKSLHTHRAIGCHRHHRHPDRAIAPGGAKNPGSRRAHEVQ
jgi:hypothetical protein